MSMIPWDVIPEILSRLRLETLLQLRTVSKRWCSLIDSHEFKKKHLLHSLNTCSLNYILKDISLFSVDLNTVDDQVILNLAYELKHPFKCEFFYYRVISHCNGLLFFSNSEKEVVLWNPSTRKHQHIQCPEMDYSLRDIIYGFGYDSGSDDYKVVRVAYVGEADDSIGSEVEVYSLKSNLWKRVQDFPYYLVARRVYGTFAGGALHWVVRRKSDSDDTKLIAAFDLATEEYEIVPQPAYEDVFHYNIDVLGGCLCIVGYDYSHHVGIWVLKEYGVESSWTKLLSFYDPVFTTHWVLEYVKPIAYSKCGKKVLLQQNEVLFWYDLEKESLAYVAINLTEVSNFYEAFVCVDSLVHLNLNDGPTKWFRHEEKELQRGNFRKAYSNYSLI